VTPVVDSHVYCFGPPTAAQMPGQQVWHALHHQPAWRIRDRAPSDARRLLDPSPGDPLRLATDVDFRTDPVHRRFVWTVDGEDDTTTSTEELKLTSSPRVTLSMRSALEELNLEELVVIHAGAESYPLAPRIRAVALTRLQEDVPPLG